jgi:hypothetical protein
LTTRQIKDGSVLAKDFEAGQLPAGTPGPPEIQGFGATFGKTTTSFSALATGCELSALATMTVRVTRPSRILVAASSAWDRMGTGLNSGVLSVALLRAGIIVARSAQGSASDFTPGVHRIGVSVTAVLFAGSDSFPATKTGYVAQPGTYTLRLDGRASDGRCSGTSRFWTPVLTYDLL